MARKTLATLRRINRLLRPAKATKAARSLHKAASGLMLAAALAPFAILAPTPASAAAKKSRKPVGVVKRLTPTPGPSGEPARKALHRQPATARTFARTHRCAAGSCNYTLYLPASEPVQPKGLIVMLHGCNQTPDDFANGTRMNALAERHGLAVVYPAQSLRRNAAGCWNWFQPAHQVRGMGEPAILASLARKLMRELRLRRDVVFVAGLSSGGAMAAILADVYPDVFSAAGIHSGMARGAAQGAMSAMSAMRVGASGGMTPARIHPARPMRWIIFQGADDGTVHPSNAAMILAAVVGDDAAPMRTRKGTARGRDYVCRDYAGSDGTIAVETWLIENAGHAWSGGRAGGYYTDPKGPSASAQMVRFFLAKSG
jgi:poly(hydroxyalkanoate) depolymerase family esterase